jgi:cytochrome c oxidase subunit 2
MLQKLLGLPINASAQGGAIDSLIGWVHLLMIVLFVGWGLLFIWMLIRFRKSKNPRADHEGVKSHASSYVEAVIAVLEIILLVGISIPFWSKKVSAFPTEAEKPVHVRIVAQQFAWNIHYPGPDGKFGKTELSKISDDNAIGLIRKGDGVDDVVELNQLYLPVNRPVIIDITTKDVIHSFFLPLFRVKQDTIPGMTIPIYFTPTQTTEEIRQQLKETLLLTSKRNFELYTPLADIKGKDDSILVKKGARLTTSTVKKLQEAGITSVDVAPANPTEIACAQLCGLNHYRMKGFVNVLPAADYDKWYADEVDSQKE